MGGAALPCETEKGPKAVMAFGKATTSPAADSKRRVDALSVAEASNES